MISVSLALRRGCLAILLLTHCPGLKAAALRIGLAADVSSLDPHFINIAPNITLAAHCFDALVHIDANGRLIPGLAQSWKAISPTQWEFRLRPGVKFHDGSTMTADDVAFSLQRPATLHASPGPFTVFTRIIVATEIVNPLTIRLKTAAPYGPLPLDMASIFIVSRAVAGKASTEDFNSGRALIGTGPFKFARFRRGESIELKRNDAYWGGKAAWDSVLLRILPAATPRLAALLAGDVDMIESVPPADIKRLRADPRFRIEQRPSWRTLLLHLDQGRNVSPFVSDNNGRSLPRNPLQDARVRLALSRSINREALTSRTLEGLAIPAAGLVAPGILGHATALTPERYDPASARQLLAAAGYAQGFILTLHGPSNRYINDGQVVQTLAQFFSRVGVRTRVETLPLSTYFSKARAGEFSASLLGWGSLAGDFALRSLLGTSNDASGWGSWNWGHYANTELDRQIGAALANVDEKQRALLSAQAMQTAIKDQAAIPLYHQMASWALRRDLRYPARIDEFTFAQQVTR